jgi:hypothetical protein
MWAPYWTHNTLENARLYVMFISSHQKTLPTYLHNATYPYICACNYYQIPHLSHIQHMKTGKPLAL